MVTRIHHDQKTNRVTGVSYIDADGKECFQKAKAVIVSGYAIETPRLLLNSACPGYESGLANSSGTVGRYLMAQIGNVIMGRFDEPVRMYPFAPRPRRITSKRGKPMKRWAVANHVPELDRFRLTFTFPALNAGRGIYLESIDPRTKDTVANVLKAEDMDFRPFPVQKVEPTSKNYVWFLTKATASSPR